MMTEDQAKDMVCPILDARSHLRVPGPGGGQGPQACIGSACMMWRWEKRPEYSKKPVGPEGLGYCGVGGKP